MNRKPSISLNLSDAIEGFIYYKQAEGIRPLTIVEYRHALRIFSNKHAAINLSEIRSAEISKYLAWLRTEYKPVRKSGNTKPLSDKSIRNHWVCLKSFFKWLAAETRRENQMNNVPGPKFNSPSIDPFSKEEIESILAICLSSRKAKTNFRRPFSMRRPTYERDIAALLFLLDTGLRAAEFCSLNIGDVDLQTGKVIVKDGEFGGAKGGRGRTVFIGKQTRHALWKYLATRSDGKVISSPLFMTKGKAKMQPNSLRLLVVSLGKRAGVLKCHPHRFRHTFATTYLRSGGDVLSLQALLGHRSLEMVRHYSRIAEVDLAESHRRASPVDNWGL